MARNKFLAALLLRPLSWLYGGVVKLRNLFFKWGILKETSFDIPIVVIGNLVVGGTGKTPHTEMVVEMLKHKYNVAVLSRGYKRNTKGFVLANRHSTPLDIGDEPYQIYHKFDCSVPVAVCESRVKGINELLRVSPQINLVILDDAFQHRYIRPTVSILLTEFNHPAFNDHLLPYGKLREPYKAIDRADIVVATKCPPDIRPLDYSLFRQNLKLLPYQKLYFSSVSYQPLKAVFTDDVPPEDMPRLDWLTKDDAILALSGIANPRPFIAWLRKSAAKVKSKSFPDHHYYQKRDLETIKNLYGMLPGNGRKIIITTEKDAVRLANNPYFPPELKSKIFYLPIGVKMDPARSYTFANDLEKKIKENINRNKTLQTNIS